MAVTQFTLMLSVVFIAIILSVVVGTWGGKNDNMVAPSLVVFGLVIPFCFSFVYIALSSFITTTHWLVSIFDFWPETVVFAGSWVGGYLGLRAGDTWHRDNDQSSFQCLLLYICVVAVGTLIALIFT